MELSEVDNNIKASFHQRTSSSDDESELQWAAIERLPTTRRLRTSLCDPNLINDDQKSDAKPVLVDVTKLGTVKRRIFIDNLITKIEDDNLRLLQKLKERIDKVGLEFSSVEVRYQNLSVEAECEVVDAKPLPTLWNTIKNMFSVMVKIIGHKSEVYKLNILKDINGIIKPSRMALLLGPPGCGKTTFLKALAGNLNQQSLKVTGDVSYNGYKLKEFVPQKTAAFISQYDLHIPEMTVRETLDFSARCQGPGRRTDVLKEISRREKQAGIVPEPDIDTYMKASSVGGLKGTLQTDYILKILGLDICTDTIVGDATNRGVSGGQRRRVTTGEMIVGPTKALFMDEISNGLDSSTTFQIVTCLQQLAHITNKTIVISLLHPPPETFNLFDDVILMAEGKIVYHGPHSNVVEFFEHCGFRCPPRKGVADFLQEVLSKKDQAQYWYHTQLPHSYVSVDKFISMFKEFHVGQKLDKELSTPFNKSEYHKNSLSFNSYSLKEGELFKACLAREWLLMKRNSFVYALKSAQLVVIALITMTVFIRTRMKIDLPHAAYFMSSLFFALIRLLGNGMAEFSSTGSRLGVLNKQIDFYFYPAWACTIPNVILKVPFSLLDASVWTAITYYVIGYSPEPERFFRQLLILFLVHQVAVSFFRLVATVIRNRSLAGNCGLISLLVMYLFGGFLIPLTSLPVWLRWAFWISPLAYAELGISLNEFLAPRWQKITSSNTTIAYQVLKKRGLNYDDYFYWISVAALLGFWILYNIGFTLALTYMKPPGRSTAIISRQKLSYLKGKEILSSETKEKELPSAAEKKTGMVLPFEPITLTIENLKYFVITPKKLRDQGFPENKLQLLHDITGAFRPGVLTALMGDNGAGKTTLMDVLAGRKTGGFVEGDVRVGGYPMVQETYARISGYCDQFDIHSPQITIEESVIYSAWLRLPPSIDRHTKSEFVAQVLQLIELDELKDALVGAPGSGGISSEQRKRLTVAVELVSNPSIIFMDEPTTGLDARSAAVVMRVVKKIVRTMRTIVCTIHQPSIDIFEAFDELVLMKRGGQMIYSGELGQHSSKLIEYFEGISGVPRIKENYNPATWMLEVSNPSAEARLDLDFAELYKKSDLCRKNEELVRELSKPKKGSKELKFSTRFPQNELEQFKACLWKQHLTYWRSPKYNVVRMAFTIFCSLLLGVVLWQKGQKIHDNQDIRTILGCMYIFMQIIGIHNCSAVLPFIAAERHVVNRERVAGMHSSWAYSIAQVIIEIPYILFQAILFTAITYPTINFYRSGYKVFWYLYTVFCSILFFIYLGMLLVSTTPTYQVASVFSSLCFTLLNLFSGYLVPGPVIPKWWRWCYWICPTAWSLKGFLTSQYGDIKDEITVYGGQKVISAYLESHYGYYYDNLPLVAVLILAFPLMIAYAFANAIEKLNFQKR